MSNFVFAQDTETCENALPPRLTVGERARLGDEGEPSRIRNAPSLSGEFIENLYPGEEVLITDGPVCADGYNWWQIQRAIDTEPIGWTVEGTDEDYWLEPTNLGGYYLAYLTHVGTEDYLHLYEIEAQTDRITWSGDTFGFAWMPDGKGMMISRGHNGIIFLNLEEGWTEEISTEPAAYPQVSPDGLWVYSNWGNNLSRQRPDGTDFTLLPSLLDEYGIGDYYYRVSPNGRWVVFGHTVPDRTGGSNRIAAVTDVNGSGSHLLTPEGDYWDSRFAWSPDSRSIAVLRYDSIPNTPSLVGRIIILPVEGNQLIATIEGAEDTATPDWSASLNRIAYVCVDEATSSSRRAICSINPDATDRQILLALQGATLSELKWSPDGHYIAYASRDNELWVLDVKSGEATRLSSELPNLDLARFAWSPRPVSEIDTSTDLPNPTVTPTALPISVSPTPLATTRSLVCEITWSIGPADEGCAHYAAESTDAAYQGFEHGFMIWQADTRQIWAFAEGHASIYDDTWDGSPLVFTETAPSGLIQPDRGFGNIWLNNADLRQDLGWATTGEIPYTMTRQSGFNNEMEPIIRFSLPDSRIVEAFLYSYEEGAYFGDWYIRD